MNNYFQHNIEVLTEKNVLITSIDTRIGFDLAIVLALKGANLIVGTRSNERFEQLVKIVYSHVEQCKIDVCLCNFNSYSSIFGFSKFIKELNKEVHHVIFTNSYLEKDNERTLNNHSRIIGNDFVATYLLLSSLNDTLMEKSGAKVIFLLSRFTKKVVSKQVKSALEKYTSSELMEYMSSKFLLGAFCSTMMNSLNIYNFPERKKTKFVAVNVGLTSLSKVNVVTNNKYVTKICNDSTILSIAYAVCNKHVINRDYIQKRGILNLFGKPKRYNLPVKLVNGSAQLMYDVGKFFKQKGYINER